MVVVVADDVLVIIQLLINHLLHQLNSCQSSNIAGLLKLISYEWS